MDMRTTTTLYGAPETGMNYAVMTQLAQYYDIPNFTEAGCVNAPVPDAQAGMEASLSIMLAQLMGANLVHDVGYLEGGKTGSLTFLTMCNDFMDAARYMGAGTRINRETMAVEEIHEVGPGGNFVSHPHTFEHFRQEIWLPKLFNRSFWDNWVGEGAKTLEQKAREWTGEILTAHQAEPLPDNVLAGMRDIIAEIER